MFHNFSFFLFFYFIDLSLAAAGIARVANLLAGIRGWQ
jgi:hypothetical protein